LAWVRPMPEPMDGVAIAWSQPRDWLKHPDGTTDFSCLFLCPLMGSLTSAQAMHLITLWGM